MTESSGNTSGVRAGNGGKPRSSSERRQDERYEFTQSRFVARIKQPGDVAPQDRMVCAQNLGAGGMSVLHDGYVHRGSEFSAQLTTLHGTWHDVTGTVVDCQLVRGRQHVLGIQFHERIEPSEYCRDAVHPRVLLADDDASIARMASHFLSKLNAEVVCVSDGLEAIEKATSAVFDLILMDVDMPNLDGLSATKQLRDRGYTGIIVAATAHTQPEDRVRCTQAGCDNYLPKPYSPESLRSLLEALHREPIFSSMTDDASMAELISDFVSRLPLQIRELEHAVASQNVNALEQAVRQLKAEGTSYGFEVITDTAQQIEAALVNGQAIDALREKVAGFIKLCSQVRVTSATGATPMPVSRESK